MRATFDCGSAKKGSVYTVKFFDKKLIIRAEGSDASYCHCSNQWQMVTPGPQSTAWFLNSQAVNSIWNKEYVDMPFFRGTIPNTLMPIIKPKKSLMNKLSIIAKKLLDADTATLVKAGYLDSELDLTEEGGEALDAILFAANKAALVEAANEKLAEEKTSKA